MIEKQIGTENWEKLEYENLLEQLENEDNWIEQDPQDRTRRTRGLKGN